MTKNDKEQLIEAIWYQMPSITLHSKTTDNETIVVEVETLKEFIRNFQNEPTEGSTEEKDCCAKPDYEAMYRELEAKYMDLQGCHQFVNAKLDRALASLRTFEFVYGRKLDGIG